VGNDVSGFFESWVDWRRTGYPMLTPATTNRTNGVIPRKLSLPQTEINLNADKVKEGPGIQFLSRHQR
jgi:hypothetical protein